MPRTGETAGPGEGITIREYADACERRTGEVHPGVQGFTTPDALSESRRAWAGRLPAESPEPVGSPPSEQAANDSPRIAERKAADRIILAGSPLDPRKVASGTGWPRRQ
jgi:hypothetical protein